MSEIGVFKATEFLKTNFPLETFYSLTITLKKITARSRRYFLFHMFLCCQSRFYYSFRKRMISVSYKFVALL